jgi:hypothetical protein
LCRRLKILLGIQAIELAILIGATVHHDGAAADRAIFYIIGIATGGVNQGLEAFTAVRAANVLGIEHVLIFKSVA